MSDQPTVSAPSFFRRKIAGIPVLYLVGGFVVVLVVIAWRLKPSAITGESAGEAAPESADDTIRDGSIYPPLPLGTVSTPQSGNPDGAANPTPDSGNASIETNNDWLKAGVEFLVSKREGPVEAQTALSAYLNGEDLTFAQKELVDQVISEYGLPPDPGSVGSVSPAPAKAQGPLPRAHVVKSTNEDSVGELAILYYGAVTVPRMNLIVNANGGKAQFRVGETAHIPVLPQSFTPTIHRVRTTAEDSPGELAKYYYGRTDAFAISVITKANGNRNKFFVGDTVNIPALPKPGG